MMDYMTHLPWTSQRHDAVWVIVDRLTKSTHFLAVRSSADDLYTGGILQVIHKIDCLVTWSTSVHSIGQGSHIHRTFLEEFLEGHGDTVDNEHYVSSIDRWLVGEDHTGFRGHATSMYPGF